jgi:hypothetical protein
MDALAIRTEAARLVRSHAARLGMDSLAADVLVNAIEALPAHKFSEEDCPGHVASADPKVCARCGVHVDSFRPLDDEDVQP